MCIKMGMIILQVTVGDLEWSLMSILKARQRLKAAHAQQQKLLEVLNEVMPEVKHASDVLVI